MGLAPMIRSRFVGGAALVALTAAAASGFDAFVHGAGATRPLTAAQDAGLGPGRWQAPVTVTRRADPLSRVGGAVAADGRGLVVWQSRQPESAIVGVSVGADGALRAPFVLSTQGEPGADPMVGMAEHGEAIVAWTARRLGTGVAACILPAGASACEAHHVSAPGRRPQLRSLAVAPNGRAVIAWTERRGRAWRVAVAQREPGGAFGAPRTIGSAGSRSPNDVEAALGAGGDAAVAFERTTRRSRHEIRLATWRAPGSPRQAVRVSPHAREIAQTRVAVDAVGDAVVAWERVSRRARTASVGIRARFRRGPRARFGRVRRIAARAGSALSVAVAGSGRRLVLTWKQAPRGAGPEPPLRGRLALQIYAAQWSNGSLRRPVRVSDRRYSSVDPEVAAAGDRTLVVYSEGGRPGARSGLTVATMATGGGLAFGPRAGLESGSLHQPGVYPQRRVALARSGAAMVFGVGEAGDVAMARLPAP